MGLEIFALHIILRKYFIVYHKSNGITTMKKHVEIEQKTFIKKFIKDQTNVVVFPFTCDIKCLFFFFLLQLTCVKNIIIFNKLGFWKM
jgi:hypothetical protein